MNSNSFKCLSWQQLSCFFCPQWLSTKPKEIYFLAITPLGEGKKKNPCLLRTTWLQLQLFLSKSQRSYVIGIPSIQCIDFVSFSLSSPEQCRVHPGSLQISLSFKLPEVVSIEKAYLSQYEQLPPYSPFILKTDYLFIKMLTLKPKDTTMLCEISGGSKVISSLQSHLQLTNLSHI